MSIAYATVSSLSSWAFLRVAKSHVRSVACAANGASFSRTMLRLRTILSTRRPCSCCCAASRWSYMQGMRKIVMAIGRTHRGSKEHDRRRRGCRRRRRELPAERVEELGCVGKVDVAVRVGRVAVREHGELVQGPCNVVGQRRVEREHEAMEQSQVYVDASGLSARLACVW